MAHFTSTEDKWVSDLESRATGDAASMMERSLTSSQLTGYPEQTVFLNVYDLHEAISFLAPLGLGLFHAGIEVNGKEYHYGRGSQGNGIGENAPRLCLPHIFREQYVLGVTPLSRFRIEEMMERLQRDEEWDAKRYHLVRHNCLHFAQHVAQFLLPVSCRVDLQVQQLQHGKQPGSGPIVYVGGTEENVEWNASGSGSSGASGGSSGQPPALTATHIQLPSLIPSHVDRMSRFIAAHAPAAVIEKLDSWDKVGGSHCQC